MLVKALKTLLAGFFKLVLRARITGLEHYPHTEKHVLIVANHVSVFDGVLLFALLPDIPLLVGLANNKSRWLRLVLRLIPHINSDSVNTLLLTTLSQHLAGGRRIIMFPEGRVSPTGALMKTYIGPALVAARADAVILPVHIDGPQFSVFSGVANRLRKRWLPPLRLTILPARRFDVSSKNSAARRARIERMLDDTMLELSYVGADIERTLFDALLDAGGRFGNSRIILSDHRAATLSYRELFRRSFVLAEHLRQVFGKQCPDEQRFIGLFLPNGVVTLTAFLALHLTGRTPVMLQYTADLQALMSACLIADVNTICTTRAFVKSAKLEHTIAQLDRRQQLIFLDDLAQQNSLGINLRSWWRTLFARRSYRALAGSITPDDAAAVLFSTDTLDKPKGIVLSHRNVLAHYAQFNALMDITAADTALNTLATVQAFGLVTATLVPLLQGVKVYLYPLAQQSQAMSTVAYRECPSLLFVTSGQLGNYAKHAHSYDFFSVRLLVSDTEHLNAGIRRMWADKFGLRVINCYGVESSGSLLTVNAPRAYRTDTIGRLAPALEYYLQSVDGLKGGRLFVRGAGIAQGFLQHDKPNKPLSPRTSRGVGWLDTGAIVTIDDDGFVTLMGQAKRYANIAGEKVSLAGLESLAGSLWPQERHVAITVTDATKGEQLVLLTTHYNASRNDLIKAVQQSGIGETYIPQQVIVVNELPSLGSGKRSHTLARQLAAALISAQPRTQH